jgi:cytochrome c-type biogenesis protein CcsB
MTPDTNLETALVCIALASYLLAARLTATRGPAAAALRAAGMACNLGALAWRAARAGRLPLASQYEFALCLGLAIAVIVSTRAISGRVKHLGAYALPAAALMMALALLSPRELKPLMPALRSPWLTVHVGLAIASYAAFAVAAGAGALYLRGEGRTPRPAGGGGASPRPAGGGGASPEATGLDALQYRLVAVGYLGLTMTILSGAVWGHQAWGRYWGWDPKETWSLITWIVYSIYLHLRLRRGWSRRRGAWLAVAAFVCVLFTFVGVNVLLPGLHSYR